MPALHVLANGPELGVAAEHLDILVSFRILSWIPNVAALATWADSSTTIAWIAQPTVTPISANGTEGKEKATAEKATAEKATAEIKCCCDRLNQATPNTSSLAVFPYNCTENEQGTMEQKELFQWIDIALAVLL